MTAQDTCALRLAQPGDVARIDAHLAACPETSMLLRTNLAAHGLVRSDAPRATEMFVNASGIVGLSNSGYLMVQMPDPTDFGAARTHWDGRAVLGITGVPAQVTHVLVGLGLAAAPTSLDEVEPLYALDLAHLAAPFGDLRAPRPGDADMLNRWFFEYRQDTGSTGSDATAWAEAQARTRRAITNNATHILEDGRQPVAMTTFNAEVADIVQVGGVFFPRHLRNRGYGRRVVAAHLAEARARGVARAILFAASNAASRAYEGIGFQRIGDYRVVLFAPPAMIKEDS